MLLRTYSINITNGTLSCVVACGLPLVRLLQTYDCYDLMPNCSKSVVFDTQLDVRLLIKKIFSVFFVLRGIIAAVVC